MLTTKPLAFSKPDPDRPRKHFMQAELRSVVLPAKSRRRVEQPAAIGRRKANGHSVAQGGGSGNKVAVGLVEPRVAVGVEVGEQRPHRCRFAANRAVCQALVLEMQPPGRDVLWPDAGQVLGPVALDSREHQELEDVALAI